MNIMDGKESATLSVAEMAKVAATVSDVEPTVKTDEKAPASSAVTGEEKPEPKKEEADPKEAEIAGLKAELSRVRKSREGSDGKIEQLEQSIKTLQDQLKQSKEPDFTDDELVEVKTEWTDILAEARLDLRDAKREGNQDAIKSAEDKIAKAKGQINLAEKKIFKRTQEAGLKRIEQASEEQTVIDDISTMYAEMSKAYPDIVKVGTPLHEAARKELQGMNPGLRKRLGVMDELVAGQRAIAKNSDLIKSVERKALLDDIEKATVVKTTPNAPTAPGRNTATVDYSKMTAAEMEAMIQRVISGA